MSKYIASWSPLTGDPDLLNELMYDLGVKRDVVLQDVLDMETDLNNALALIIIYPESEDDERKKDVEEQQRKPIEPELAGIRCFIKQNIDNACGLIAIVNAILNSRACVSIQDGSILEEIAKRGSIEASDELLSIYNKAVIKDYSDSDAPVDHHFTVLTEVRVGGLDDDLETYVVELDGERRSPYIPASSQGSSLRDTSYVRGIFDALRKDTHSAAVYKLVLIV